MDPAADKLTSIPETTKPPLQPGSEVVQMKEERIQPDLSSHLLRFEKEIRTDLTGEVQPVTAREWLYNQLTNLESRLSTCVSDSDWIKELESIRRFIKEYNDDDRVWRPPLSFNLLDEQEWRLQFLLDSFLKMFELLMGESICGERPQFLRPRGDTACACVSALRWIKFMNQRHPDPGFAGGIAPEVQHIWNMLSNT